MINKRVVNMSGVKKDVVTSTAAKSCLQGKMLTLC